MKKFMALLLMLGMIFLMAACDSDTEIKSNQTTSNNSDTTLNASRSDNTSKPFERNTSKLNLSEKKISKRDYFSNPTNAETVTLLIYLCGSDLESNYGCATYDIEEILNADIGDNVNIIMETGGAKYWDNNTIPIENTRYQLTNHGLTLLDDSLGNRDMTDPETLSNFINYGVSNYPADRYMLILWDHGGGSLGGFAYDQRFPSSSAMTLSEIDQALSTSDVYFDFIGFDACLMATLETAFVLEEYTDYMIAS
ncbi:MAG: clostripain-related cysteine peptidase, partial [Anaerotignaceae bacterium]